MSKYVLIPDSFKGTLSSADICRIAAEEILRLEPSAEVCAIPVADGGEGTVDAFLAAVGGRRIEAPCTGPWGEPVTAHYALLPDGTAVVEMAAAAGLPLAGTLRPEKTTTYGVGQLMAHALSHGAVRLVLGAGRAAPPTMAAAAPPRRWGRNFSMNRGAPSCRWAARSHASPVSGRRRCAGRWAAYR